jgi:Ulp1 family protease
VGANRYRAHWFVTIICNLDKAKPRAEHPLTPPKMRTRSSQHDPSSDTEDGDVLQLPIPKKRSSSPTPLEDSDGQINRGISQMSLTEGEYDFRSDPTISAEDRREIEAARTGRERRKSRDVISVDDESPGTSISALIKARNRPPSPVPEHVPEHVPEKVPEKRAARRTSRNPIPVNEPVIIIFDSLGLTHPNVFKALREYVVDEAREKRNLDLDPSDLYGVRAKVPIQSNYADCGVYLLHYVQRFLREPERYLPDILVPPKTPL